MKDPVRTVDRYLARLKHLGLDVVEISTGFLSLPLDDWLRLVDRVHSAGLIAKPGIEIQFGAGGDTAAADLESMGTSDLSKVVNLGRRFINEAGVERIMVESSDVLDWLGLQAPALAWLRASLVESEGITENVKGWRTDVIQRILKELPSEKVMFEAADPQVFN
ncbi:Phosphosulfolactate synthase [Mycena venus]|uniref:Phosphosulfolactate synthase n=1 Tax=Mycena venus TaxID=2733690 RepID=A0A8H6X650_9AGAR|nr:Phosphosulfolactate synthase [Mycena venus]